MKELYENYATIIIFLHILSAVVWIGGMIAIRFAVHPALQSIEDANVRFGKSLEITRKLFHLVFPFIIISLLCALVLIIGAGYGGWKVHLKEAIWTAMTANYLYMYMQRFRAARAFKKGDFDRAKELVKLLPTKLLPLNIVLGVVAILFGVIIRGF